MPDKHYIFHVNKRVKRKSDKEFGSQIFTAISGNIFKKFWTFKFSPLFNKLNTDTETPLNLNECLIYVNNGSNRYKSLTMHSLTLDHLRVPDTSQNDQSPPTGCANIHGKSGCVPQLYYSKESDNIMFLKVEINFYLKYQIMAKVLS